MSNRVNNLVIADAINRLGVAVAALDLASRNHAQLFSRTDERLVEMHNSLDAQANVVNAIDTESKQTETHFRQACANIIGRYKVKNEFDEAMHNKDCRVDTIAFEMQRLGKALTAACTLDAS